MLCNPPIRSPVLRSNPIPIPIPMSTTILPPLFPEIPSLSSIYWAGLSKRHPVPLASQSPPLPKTLNPRLRCHANARAMSNAFPLSSTTNQKPCVLIKPVPSTSAVSAGRSKKNPGPGHGRIEGSGEIRRRAKENAHRRSRRLAENLFYRRNSPSSSRFMHADSFTEEELQMIGLGYDRYVRFMSKDDPNLRHPYDWYKYGRYGPYSWRGIVVGNPIRGRFSDERVTLYGEVRDHEEWEEIERFDMASDFSRRLESLDPSIGFRHYWVFVRHPKWRPTELPWQQWTLVSEVVIEAGKHQRLDKWSLMGRLGSKTRSMITQCAAWMRPDIIYVKRPVYQCRFEPQDDFFKLLGPLLDPTTEKEYPCELKLEDEEEGRVTSCTYFGGLCRIVKISPKAYVDDVVNAYQKLSDEGKSKCLEFLLTNHPMELLHPYTKEWKAKLEEMELGCDAPDDSEDDNQGETQITDWIEDSDESGADDDDEEEDEDDVVIDLGRGKEGEESGTEVDDANPEESEEYWNEQWNKALSSSEAMENFVKKSVQVSSEFYKKQMMMEQEQIKQRNEEGSSSGTISVNQESREEWQSMGNRSPRRKVNKSKKPPELFLRAAVRPFTYRNLVKEIVLMRHAIIDGDISGSI